MKTCVFFSAENFSSLAAHFSRKEEKKKTSRKIEEKSGEKQEFFEAQAREIFLEFSLCACKARLSAMIKSFVQLKNCCFSCRSKAKQRHVNEKRSHSLVRFNSFQTDFKCIYVEKTDALFRMNCGNFSPIFHRYS